MRVEFHWPRSSLPGLPDYFLNGHSPHRYWRGCGFKSLDIHLYILTNDYFMKMLYTVDVITSEYKLTSNSHDWLFHNLLVRVCWPQCRCQSHFELACQCIYSQAGLLLVIISFIRELPLLLFIYPAWLTSSWPSRWICQSLQYTESAHCFQRWQVQILVARHDFVYSVLLE